MATSLSSDSRARHIPGRTLLNQRCAVCVIASPVGDRVRRSILKVEEPFGCKSWMRWKVATVFPKVGKRWHIASQILSVCPRPSYPPSEDGPTSAYCKGLPDAGRSRCAWRGPSWGWGRHPKTLYGACRCQEKNRHALKLFCHVIRLHCGTAALLLGCAERSQPRSCVRRAEGAGVDRECAARVQNAVAATCKCPPALFDLRRGFLFCRFSFHRHASSRSLKIRFDMIRGELAIGRGNRA